MLLKKQENAITQNNCSISPAFSRPAPNIKNIYRTQGQIMFSEASICSQGEEVGQTPLPQNADAPEAHPPLEGRPFLECGPSRKADHLWKAEHPPKTDPPLLTSIGRYCSGGYASYWNAFLLILISHRDLQFFLNIDLSKTFLNPHVSNN